ncbi:MAG TPA: tungsten ABC transporter substrate-binding protein, partial [Methanocorpusculum sp.]|nr:tungsten ABC transporter substrate-binding protein [Methanocorpusculum sp.]
NIEDATDFTNWLISEEGQDFIGAYGTEEFGKPLFFPMTTVADTTKAPFSIDSTTPATVPTA